MMIEQKIKDIVKKTKSFVKKNNIIYSLVGGLSMFSMNCGGNEPLTRCHSHMDCRTGRICLSNGECATPGWVKECLDEQGNICQLDVLNKFTIADVIDEEAGRIAWDGYDIYTPGDYGEKIFRVNPFTQNLTEEYSIPYEVDGFAHKTGNRFFLTDRTVLYEVMLAGGRVSSVRKLYDGKMAVANLLGNVAWDGQSIWTLSESCKLRRFTETGEKIGELILDETFENFKEYIDDCYYIVGLTSGDDSLWFAFEERIFKLNPTESKLTVYGGPENVPLGIAWGGSYLWYCGNPKGSWRSELYKLSVPR
jgi:hypothetical protein